ncbi:MAG: MerR family transcriptional regulator [Deltaproteobacteria bacterium]|nr:MerR family transcriptional regulator [Deltaproteobacteria bacterium]
MGTTTYKLEELARAAGTSPRTVRYYVQRGLLPPPAFRGRDTGYEREHLVRLRAIKRMQEEYFPLDAIAAELASRSLAEIERIAEGTLLPRTSTHADPLQADRGSSDRRAELVVRETRATRLELAPGVVLLVDDEAPAGSRSLVQDLLASLQATSRMREGR